MATPRLQPGDVSPDGYTAIGEIRLPHRPPSVPNPLDSEAWTNLRDIPGAMDRYEDYKRDLTARGVSAEDMDDILRGFIWSELGD